MDYVVSSYTPTLSTLLKAQEKFPEVSPTQSPVALIGESAAPGLPRLPYVKSELALVHEILTSRGVPLRNSVVADEVTLSTINADAASSILEEAAIAHFACHGIQDSHSPLRSGFHLSDGRLTVTQLMRLRLPSAIFAFLSACETARGARKHPDQAVHLCATMLFCGFRSVVGTLWGMNDMDGPTVAGTLYRELVARDVISIDDAAYALDAAVWELRKEGAGVERWAPFVHYGA